MFEFIDKFSSGGPIEKVKFADNFLVTALSSASIAIFDIRSSCLLFEIPLHQEIQDYCILENTLYYTTKVHTVVYDITTKQQLCRTITGSLVPVDGILYIVTLTTLMSNQGKTTKQIKVFEYGITSSCVSVDRRSLALSSNKVYIYDTLTLENKELSIKLKLLAVSETYVAGKGAQKDKVQVYLITTEELVFQFKEQQTLKCQIVGPNLYYLTSVDLKITSLFSKQHLLTIVLPKTPSDILVHKGTVYALCGLQLYGYNLKQDKHFQEQSAFIKKSSAPLQPSIIEDNLQETYVHSEDFEIKGIISNLVSQHDKFIANLNHRSKAVSAIYKWLSTGNIKATMFALERQQDTSIIFDCLKFLRSTVGQLPEGEFPLLIKLGGKLVSSKYSSHVNYGIEFINGVLRLVDRSGAATLKNIKSELRNIKESQRVQKILKMNVGEDRRQLYEDVYEMCFNIDKILNSQLV